MARKVLSKNQKFTVISVVVLIAVLIAAMVIFAFVRILIHVTANDDRSYYIMMGKDENIVALLERGEIIQGNVTRAYYEHWAPSGWRVEYDFYITDTSSVNSQTYWGWTKGPKKYYANLSAGDEIEVIYDPCDPRINSEVRSFINHPGKRQVFKRNGRMHLLDKFKGKYKLEDYNLRRWHYQTIEK